MFKIEKKTFETPLGETKTYYYDAVKPAEYRRMVGGIAWPFGEKPGFICVIAEDFHKNYRMKLRNFRLLDEYSNISTEKLVRRLYDFQNRYLVDPWYGDPANVLMIHFIDRFNQALPKKKKGVYIADAPFADDVHNLRLYGHQIRIRMSQAKKSLHFGGKSMIPGHLSGLSPDDVQKDKAQEHPVVAALGYALAGLDEPYADISRDRELQDAYATQRMVEGL